MPKTILILRPSKDMAAAAMTAIERFQKVSGMELTVYRQNINQAADAIEAGRIDVIFTATVMERSEANVFIGCMERSKNPPYVIASPDNAEKIQAAVPVDKLCTAKNDFTLEFIFACLRNLLTPGNYKLDTRYFKSILTSVMDVVYRNTQLRLVPAQVNEVKAEESTETIAAVMTFYGDGIYGSPTDPTDLLAALAAFTWDGEDLYRGVDNDRLQHEAQVCHKAEFLYSSIGYALLQKYLEERMKSPFATMMEKEILQPLGMKQTSTDSPLDERAPGYSGDYPYFQRRGRKIDADLILQNPLMLASTGYWSHLSDLVILAGASSQSDRFLG